MTPKNLCEIDDDIKSFKLQKFAKTCKKQKLAFQNWATSNDFIDTNK